MKSGSKKSIAADSYFSSGTLRSRITVSRDLAKYFRRFDFWSRYDAEISANNSVLNIPVLSILLPLAWITGADVYVDELDRTFAESVDAVHREYKRMYPGLPFTTRLVADRLVDNKYDSKETALLFSGGVDSTYSLFRNITLKPRLVMIYGTSDIALSNLAFQKALEREYSGFAEREGLTLNLIRTNMLEILDTGRVDHLYGSLSRFQRKTQHYWTYHLPLYWNGIGYAFAYVGQAAPLSTGRFNRLLIGGSALASEYDLKGPKAEYFDSEFPVRRIAWANLRVKDDGKIHKFEKAFFLKKFFDAHKFKLRPCLEAGAAYTQPMQSPHAEDRLNCSRCRKCLKVIAELELAGIDPNVCGFSVDTSTLYEIEALLRSGSSLHPYWLKAVQRAIPDRIEHDLHGSRQFFEWFKRLDIDSIAGPYCSPLSSIYHTLPYLIANILRIVMEKTPVRRLRYRTDLAFAPTQRTAAARAMKSENQPNQLISRLATDP